MECDPNIHHRRSIRLKGYDYTQPGGYFVTFCSYQRDEIFGEISNGEMRLSALGKLVHEEWLHSADIRKEIQLFEDEFIVMPNAHGIVWIMDTAVGRMPCAPTRQNGTHAVRPYRGRHDHWDHLWRGSRHRSPRTKRELNLTGIWQRNYYDHIIRNDRELNNIRWYIQNNLLNWQLDRDNTQNIRKLSPPEQVEEYVRDVEDMVLKLK